MKYEDDSEEEMMGEKKSSGSGMKMMDMARDKVLQMLADHAESQQDSKIMKSSEKRDKEDKPETEGIEVMEVQLLAENPKDSIKEKIAMLEKELAKLKEMYPDEEDEDESNLDDDIDEMMS